MSHGYGPTMPIAECGLENADLKNSGTPQSEIHNPQSNALTVSCLRVSTIKQRDEETIAYFDKGNRNRKEKKEAELFELCALIQRPLLLPKSIWEICEERG